jgi:hypothetical protein
MGNILSLAHGDTSHAETNKNNYPTVFFHNRLPWDPGKNNLTKTVQVISARVLASHYCPNPNIFQWDPGGEQKARGPCLGGRPGFYTKSSLIDIYKTNGYIVNRFTIKGFTIMKEDYTP